MTLRPWRASTHSKPDTWPTPPTRPTGPPGDGALPKPRSGGLLRGRVDDAAGRRSRSPARRARGRRRGDHRAARRRASRRPDLREAATSAGRASGRPAASSPTPTSRSSSRSSRGSARPARRRRSCARASREAFDEDPDSYVAISTRCAHLGCPVNFVAAAGNFVCPCHGGVYDFEGKVIGGPPVRPLDRFQTRVGNGQVADRPPLQRHLAARAGPRPRPRASTPAGSGTTSIRRGPTSSRRPRGAEMKFPDA